MRDQKNKGRITKDAVRTMIADVLLWKAAFTTYNEGKGDGGAAAQECYDECIRYCDLVINTRMDYVKSKHKEDKYRMPSILVNDSLPLVYPLGSTLELTDKLKRFPHAPYEYMFAEDCNHFYESIFEIQHDNILASLGNYEVPYFYGCATDDARKKFTPGVLSAPSYLAQVKNGLYKRTDFRRVNNVFAKNSDGSDVDKFGIIKYGHSNASENREGMNTYDINFGKMSYEFNMTLNDKDRGRYLSLDYVNWIVYRISDVMLMKAEALAWRNANEADLNKAFSLVEAIYNRSQAFFYEDGVPMYGVENDDEFKKEKDEDILILVLKERQREFAFEGKRWFDLVRYALFTSKDGTTDVMFSKTKMLDHKYTSNKDQYAAKMGTINSLFFPIAEREINTNPDLKQNDAYKTTNTTEKN